MDLRKRVLTGLGWSAGTKFLGQLITWTITIIVMRLLTPGDYGLMAMAGVFIAFLALLNELGLGAALIQRQKIDEATVRQIFGMLLMVNFCLFLILLLVAPLVGVFFNEPRVVPIVRLLSTQFVIMPFGIVPQSLLTREMDFKKISIVELVSALSGSMVTLLLALSGWGVWSLVWGSMAITISRTIGVNVLGPGILTPIFFFRGMWQAIRFGGYVTANRVLWWSYSQADTFIIGRLLGKELLGFYSVGMNLATLPMEKVSGIINQVAFPAFSTIQADLQKTRAHFLKAVRVMSFLAFPVLWGMSSIAPDLIAVLLGDKWHMASLPFQLISLLIPIRMVSNLLGNPMLAIGRADICCYNSLLGFVVMPLAMFIFAYWGLAGVCLAWLVFFPFVFLLNLSRVARILQTNVAEVLRVMTKPAAAALIMYAVVLGLKTVLKNDSASIWHLLLLIAVGTTVYTGIITRLDRERVREVWKLIRI